MQHVSPDQKLYLRLDWWVVLFMLSKLSQDRTSVMIGKQACSFRYSESASIRKDFKGHQSKGNPTIERGTDRIFVATASIKIERSITSQCPISKCSIKLRSKVYIKFDGNVAIDTKTLPLIKVHE